METKITTGINEIKSKNLTLFCCRPECLKYTVPIMKKSPGNTKFRVDSENAAIMPKIKVRSSMLIDPTKSAKINEKQTA